MFAATAVQAIALLALSAYAVHRVYLAARRAPGRAAPEPPAPAQWPGVTVQIPLFNERYVAERAVRAAAALDYPRDRLEIQILDDSTDDTPARVAAVVANLRATGVRIAHVRRRRRAGYKAGALAAGLATARGELLAVFDADFVPPPDFLRRLVPEFHDPRVGMVQARWSWLNADASLLTRIQALQLDAHFSIEHAARAATGCFLTFNGTAGIWRRACIDDAGGWRADTLTEDLDLSYRAQLAGWRFTYRDDVAAPSELPVEVAAYRVQQQRWAQGSVETAVRILPRLLRAPVPTLVKVEACLHLLTHVTYALIVLTAGAAFCLSLGTDGAFRAGTLAVEGALLALATVSLAIFYGAAARARDPRRWRLRLALVPGVMLLGMGMALWQTAAVARGLAGRSTPFRRTPKYRQETAEDRAWRRGAYRLRTPHQAGIDLALGALVLAGAVASVSSGGAPGVFPVLLAIGSLSLGGGAFAQR